MVEKEMTKEMIAEIDRIAKAVIKNVLKTIMKIEEAQKRMKKQADGAGEFIDNYIEKMMLKNADKLTNEIRAIQKRKPRRQIVIHHLNTMAETHSI